MPQKSHALPSSSTITVGSIHALPGPHSGLPIGSVQGPSGLFAVATPMKSPPCSPSTATYQYQLPSRLIACDAHARSPCFAHLKTDVSITTPCCVQFSMSFVENTCQSGMWNQSLRGMSCPVKTQSVSPSTTGAGSGEKMWSSSMIAANPPPFRSGIVSLSDLLTLRAIVL